MTLLFEKVKDYYERAIIEYKLKGAKYEITKDERTLIKEINFMDSSTPNEESYAEIQREFFGKYLRMTDEMIYGDQTLKDVDYENQCDLEKILSITGISRKE